MKKKNKHFDRKINSFKVTNDFVVSVEMLANEKVRTQSLKVYIQLFVAHETINFPLDRFNKTANVLW